MSDRIPLEKPESEFASWLSTLDNPRALPDLRARALAKVAEMYMASRAAEDRAEKQLQAQRIRIETLEKQNAELVAYRLKIATLTADAMGNTVALVITKLERAGVEFVQTPGQRPVLRAVPNPDGGAA